MRLMWSRMSISEPCAKPLFVLDDTLQGRSGKLRARFIAAPDAENFPFLRQLFGGKSAQEVAELLGTLGARIIQIGRASCRERV